MLMLTYVKKIWTHEDIDKPKRFPLKLHSSAIKHLIFRELWIKANQWCFIQRFPKNDYVCTLFIYIFFSDDYGYHFKREYNNPVQNSNY